jgi:hypothetical protein
MNADPDFHPLAAAWLNGSATPPEQSLLGEILHGPDMMREYAALCRTEAFLGQTGSTAASHRAALGRMLAGPPWPRQALRYCQRPVFRWCAAAAVVTALALWALWPVPDGSSLRAVVKPKPSPRIMPASKATHDFPDDPTAALPPADKSIEPWLRNYYVKPIPLWGELTASVQALAAEIKMTNGEPLRVGLQSNGDAPVHLKLGVALPAWTVLEILALQSGTEAVVSGRSVVFRDAKKPVPLDGTLHEEERIRAFQAVLPVPDEYPGIRSALVAALAGESFGSSLNVHSFGPETVAFSGKSRTVLALKKACNSAPRAPQQLQWSVQVFSLPHGLFEKALAENCPDRQNTPNGLFLSDDTEHQMLVRGLSMQKGVDMLMLPIPASDPGRTAEWTSNPEGIERKRDELSAAFEGVIDSSGNLDVMVDLKMEKWHEATQGWSTQALSTQVSIQPGQTIVLGGLVGEDGLETVHLVNVKIIDTTGPPKTPEALREELPYGIPVVGKPGMVQSPYAPEKGMIDVEGFKRGTRVSCPYTGKHFRMP